MDEFIRGSVSVLAGSTAVAIGLDIPGLTAAIVIAPPVSADAFQQMAGRPGREGQRATVLLTDAVDSPSYIRALCNNTPKPVIEHNVQCVQALMDPTASSCLHLRLRQLTGISPELLNMAVSSPSGSRSGAVNIPSTEYCCLPRRPDCVPLVYQTNSSTAAVISPSFASTGSAAVRSRADAGLSQDTASGKRTRVDTGAGLDREAVAPPREVTATADGSGDVDLDRTIPDESSQE